MRYLKEFAHLYKCLKWLVVQSTNNLVIRNSYYLWNAPLGKLFINLLVRLRQLPSLLKQIY